VRYRIQIALSLVGLAACVLAVGFSAASFTDSKQNPQSVSAVTDFLAPSASASTIGKSQGGLDGTIRPGGTYYVYANVADSGNPASGIASVKADVSAITSGQTAVSLGTSGGPFTVDGVSYDYRSAQLTASSSLSAGTKAYKLTLTDAAGNSEVQEFSVSVVANTAFKASSFATDDNGGTEGKSEKGDTVTFTFNKAPDPYSVASGWNGASTKSVTVSITNDGEEDDLSVAGTNIGSVELKGDYTSSTATFSSSSMSLSGSVVTVVLGTASGSVKTDTGKSRAVWAPSGSLFDLVGNVCSTSSVSSGNQKQF
jgi:hypothetical protein